MRQWSLQIGRFDKVNTIAKLVVRRVGKRLDRFGSRWSATKLSLNRADRIRERIEEQTLALSKVWIHRGPYRAANAVMVESQGNYSGLCPRNVNELAQRLDADPEIRDGLERRAGTGV